MRFQKNDNAKPWQLGLFKRMMDNEPVPTNEVKSSVCFITTPRCGATYLCDTLTNTGQIGIIEEWFNYEYFYQWQQATDLDFTLEKYLTWVIERSVGESRVFGIHWHIAQVFTMVKDFKFGLGNFKFDHVLYLRRRDKIAQAVSMAKANKSDQFRSYEKCSNYNLPTFTETARALHILTEHEAAYDEHLKHDDHVEFWYEDFQNSPSTLDQIMRTIGLKPVDNYWSLMKVQRTANTRRVVEDFKNYLQGTYPPCEK